MNGRVVLSRRHLLQVPLAAPLVLRAGGARAEGLMPIKFTLAATLDGSNAPFLLADKMGWYREAGFACSFDASGGSGEAVSRVGSGVYDAGVGDINVLLEFASNNPNAIFPCVYMLYYRSPLSVATLAKNGIAKPADLNGCKMGAAATDGAYRLFPAYAKVTGVDPKSINWDMVGLQLREAVLARGDVQAILGFDSTMLIGLQKAGIDAADIRFLYYADAGLDLYGNGLLISDKFRKQDPAVIKRFVAVSARAWQASIADPQAAIAALKERVPLINADLELAKLRWLIKNQLVTDESRADGLGMVRAARLAKAVEVVSAAYGLKQPPTPEQIFDPSFMPPEALRKLPV